MARVEQPTAVAKTALAARVASDGATWEAVCQRKRAHEEGDDKVSWYGYGVRRGTSVAKRTCSAGGHGCYSARAVESEMKRARVE